MLGFFDRAERWLGAGERARLLHERWLNWAVSRPTSSLPKIPVRAVREGGFSALMRTEEGRAWASQWWENALARMDDKE